MQYTRNDTELRRGTYRVRGEVIHVHPAESDSEALRLELFDGEIEKLTLFDPLTGETLRTRSAEHTSELQSLMRTSYAVFCLKNHKPPHKSQNPRHAHRTNTHHDINKRHTT